MSKHSIGDRVRDLRQKAGLSQRALAKLIGVSPAGVARLEAESDYVTSRPTIMALAQVLNCDADWLQSGAGTRQRPDALSDAKGAPATGAPGWGAEVERATQMSVAIEMICRTLTEQQLTLLMAEVIRNKALNEQAKIFWTAIFAKWLVVKMDIEDHGKLTEKQKVSGRRAANDRQRADPAAGAKAS